LFKDVTGKDSKKMSPPSAPKQTKKYSKKQKRSPTVQKGEHALLRGLFPDELDGDTFILKCMPEEEWKLGFNCDPKSISEPEKNPSEPSETRTLFKDDSKDYKISFSCENNAEEHPATKAVLPSGKGANKRSRRSAPKRGKKCSKKQKRGPTAQKGEHVMLGGFSEDELDDYAYILKCTVEEKSKLEFDGHPKSIRQLEKFFVGTSETESLFMDDDDDWWRSVPRLGDLLSPGM
jgi:hypothetical protein